MPPLPRAMQDGAECTLTVGLWPKIGHSTTLNNMGYQAHKEMGSFSLLSPHLQLDLIQLRRSAGYTPASLSYTLSRSLA